MKKPAGILLVFAIAILAYAIYSAVTTETPMEKVDRQLKSININVDQDAVDSMTKSINDYKSTLNTLNKLDDDAAKLEKDIKETLDKYKTP